MRSVTIVAPDPPPLRDYPGRSAGRDSPYAEPLVQAAEALIADDPDGYPWLFSGMTIRFGRTMWNTDVLGYSPESPLYEVLCHAGAICDPDGWWSHTSQDPGSAAYVVTFLSHDGGSGRGPMPEFVLTDVPPEYRDRSFPFAPEQL